MNLKIWNVLCTATLSSTIITIIISSLLYWYIYTTPILPDKCETEKCPYCFGMESCDLFQSDDIKLSSNSFRMIVNNYFSIKNVYRANDGDDNRFVLKKLGDYGEFLDLDHLICLKNNMPTDCKITNVVNDAVDYYGAIKEVLVNDGSSKINKLKICSEVLIDDLIEYYFRKTNCKIREDCLKNLWTILQINPEPLILMLFKNYVPRYRGACGRMVVVEDVGQNLNTIKDDDFVIRLSVARKIMRGVISFTEGHEKYRLYLTDLSPDNIAIDEDLNVNFIDLENVILNLKSNGNSIHRSLHMPEHDFAYSEDRVCNSEISDHNYYATCKLILSKNAPWPMMTNGLLHTPPSYVVETYNDLFLAIEDCVKNDLNRFEMFHLILSLIDEMLTEIG